MLKVSSSTIILGSTGGDTPYSPAVSYKERGTFSFKIILPVPPSLAYDVHTSSLVGV
jgi:hypothetical protein